MEGYRGFLGLLVSALLVGFLSVIFVLVWVLHYREGLGWDGGALEFNWHPVLAVTGFVFIQGIEPSPVKLFILLLHKNALEPPLQGTSQLNGT
ncbi:hypothetical protein STEG23_017906 [Scotinomys teguina]